WTSRVPRALGAALSLSPTGTRLYMTGLQYRRTKGTWTYDLSLYAYGTRTGRLIWSTTYRAPGLVKSWGSYIAVSPNGDRLYVAGAPQRKPNNLDYLTLSYGSRTGKLLWARMYDGPAHNWDIIYSMRLDPSGRRIF